jgi:hypothetical protein
MATTIATLKLDLRVAQDREDTARKHYTDELVGQQVGNGPRRTSEQKAAALDAEFARVRRAEQARIAAQGRLNAALVSA